MNPAQKFSFGFSKVKKPNLSVKTEKKEERDFVDCFDGEKGKFSFQGNTREEEVKKALVIPLVGTRTAYDVIRAKLNIANDPKEEIKEPKNGDVPNHSAQPIDEQVAVVEKASLESLAAKEILEDLKKDGSEEKPGDSGMVIVPDKDKPVFEGEKESTLDDYENVPIGDFGLALLRGMGWKENTGIGKDGKVVPPITSKVRPKRLGLGAEGSKLVDASIDVPVNKGCFVKVLGGPCKDSYGVVESLDGDVGRAFVKLDEGGGIISLSENVIAVISKKEYEKRSADGKDEEDKKVKIEKNWKYGINVADAKNKEHDRKNRAESPEQVKKTSKKNSTKDDRIPEDGSARSKRDREEPKRGSNSDSERSRRKARDRRQDKHSRTKRSSSSESESAQRRTKRDIRKKGSRKQRSSSLDSESARRDKRESRNRRNSSVESDRSRRKSNVKDDRKGSPSSSDSSGSRKDERKSAKGSIGFKSSRNSSGNKRGLTDEMISSNDRGKKEYISEERRKNQRRDADEDSEDSKERRKRVDQRNRPSKKTSTKKRNRSSSKDSDSPPRRKVRNASSSSYEESPTRRRKHKHRSSSKEVERKTSRKKKKRGRSRSRERAADTSALKKKIKKHKRQKSSSSDDSDS